MFKELFGFGKKDRLIDSQVNRFARKMAESHWGVEEKNGRVYIFGKYRNRQRDFDRLVVNFVDGGYVKLTDTRGYLITGIPSKIERRNAVKEIKNVLNVLD